MTRQVVDAELYMSPEEWARTLPRAELLTTDDALHACDIVLSEAKGLVKQIAWSHHGTVPPPPWPAHPELVEAIKRVEEIASGLEVLSSKHIQKLHPQFKPKLRAAILDKGMRLYTETEKLRDKWETAKARTRTVSDAAMWLARQIPSPPLFFGVGIPLLAVGVGVAWLWWDAGGRRRLWHHLGL